MDWELPTKVVIEQKEYQIRENCDYRVVLDVICALNDSELTNKEKIQCALYIFYEDSGNIEDIESAIKEMYRIINGGYKNATSSGSNHRLMDWEYDFGQIAPPVSRVIGYDVRTPGKYTHWYTFLGAYMEIGECVFSNIVSIRSKRAKGKKLEKWEMDFLREHREMVELPQKMTSEEMEELNEKW